MFSKVYNSKKWRNYLSEKGMIPGWLSCAKLTRYFVKERAALRTMVMSLGDIQ